VDRVIKDASTAFLTSHDLLRVLKLIPPEVMADSRATAALAAERPISRLGSGRDCHHLGGIHRTERFGLLPLFRQPKFKLSHHRLILRQQLQTHRAN